MTLNTTHIFRAIWLFSLLGLCLSGCSFVSIDQKTRYRDAEGYFEPALLEHIKAGETSQTWLVKHFGRPWFSEVDGLEGYSPDVGIHTWRFEREQQKSTRVLLLFRSRKLNQQYEYLHVVTEGDLVKRVWRDELSTVDVRRLMAAMGYQKVQEGAQTPQQLIEPVPSASKAAEQTEVVPPPASLVVEDMPEPEVTETQEEPPAEKPPTEATPTEAPANVTSL